MHTDAVQEILIALKPPKTIPYSDQALQRALELQRTGAPIVMVLSHYPPRSHSASPTPSSP